MITTTTALLLSIVTCAHALHRPPPPAEPVFPAFQGDSSNAVIARPLAIKSFEDFGTRYWRAQYEVVAWAARSARPQEPQRVVLEWSCDAKPDGEDPCGALVDRVLPGFEGHGRTDVAFVQLELRYRHASTFDGVDLFYAARDGSMRLNTPPPIFFGGAPEGAHRKG